MATQARIAGIVQIDGVPAARDVIVISDNPAGRQVVGQGASDGSGAFDITYADWTGAVIALALDEYGQAFPAETPLNQGTIVHPTAPNGYVYEVTTAGTTGNEEPTWSTAAAVTSGGVTFSPLPYYRPVASGPISPDSVVVNPEIPVTSGLAVHYQADTIEGLSDGDLVVGWIDDGPNGVHLSTSSGSEPVYRESYANGLPSLEFVDDYLYSLSPVISGAGPRTIFVVVDPSSPGSNSTILSLGQTIYGANFLITPETGVRIEGGNQLWSDPVSGLCVLSIQLPDGGSSTSDILAWINGQLLTVSSTNVGSINTGDGIHLGGQPGKTGLVGNICEVAVYDVSLSIPDRTAVEQYLIGKWGVV